MKTSMRWWSGMVLLILLGCSREEVEPNEPPASVIREVTYQEIPEVIASLRRQMGLTHENQLLGINDGTKTLDLQIDWTRILELVSEGGKTNYTFAIHDAQADGYTFHNLVIGKNADGSFKRPYLLSYYMSDDFKKVHAATGSLEGFEGTVSKRYLSTDYFSGGGYGVNDGREPDGSSTGTGGSRDACDSDIPVSGGSGGTDPYGDSNSDQQGSSGGGLICVSYIETKVWVDRNYNSTIQEVLVIRCHQNPGYNASGGADCNEDDEDIAIIRPECVSLELKAGFFINSCDSNLKEKILKFLEENGGFDIDQQDYGLNSAERKLAEEYPACAAFFYDNKEFAIFETSKRFGGNFRDDCSDAFRHAYFNALNARVIGCGVRIAKLFSDAHETGLLPKDQYAIPMDLYNNSIGHSVGAKAGVFTTADDIAKIICNKLANGELKVLDNNRNLISSSNCDNCN